MATFTLEGGKTIEAVSSEDWRYDELAEAENALKVDASTARFAEKMQLTYFISRRRESPGAPVHVIADEAKRLKLGALSEGDEAGGPLEATDDSETPDTDEQPTTGHPLSARSG